MAETSRSPNSSTRAAWSEAEAWGCDMDQLAHQLSLSVRERLRQHDRALSAATALREAVEAHRACS